MALMLDDDMRWADKVEERENKSSRKHRWTQQCGWAAIPPQGFHHTPFQQHSRRPPPSLHISKTAHLLSASEDVGVTGIEDGHGGATEQLTAGGTQLDL